MRSRLPTLVAASFAAILFLAVQASPVHAESILNFSLNNSGSITATASGGTSTTITTTGGAQAVNIGLLNGSTVDIAAYLSLSATSSGAVTTFQGSLYQTYNGTFTITANANGSGTNYLSGTFTNVSFDSELSGLNGGTGATLSANDPTATIVFTSSVITDLSAPSTASFTFSNVSPALSVTGTTVSSFTASGSGTFSANPPPAVPEPSTLALAGIGALGMIGYGLRRRKASGA